MENKTEAARLIENYDHEFTREVDWFSVHIYLLFTELCDIQNAMYIFETIENEWNRRKENGIEIKYSVIRTILFEALPYKIVLGLSKILIGKKEFSLLRTVNKVSQMDEFKNNSTIIEIITEIQNHLATSDLVKAIAVLRDQFFAHLDKTSALSDCRVSSTFAVKNIDKHKIDEVIKLVRKLYEACFGTVLEYPRKDLAADEIIYTFFWMSGNLQYNR